MSVRLRGSTSSILAEVDASKALRVSLQPPLVTAADGGRYETVLATGLITVIAAHTATAGHIAAFRWGSTTKSCLIDYIKIAAAMVTDFTTLQQFRLAARLARAYTASHTSGTALTITGNNTKLRTSYATTAATDIRVATTAELTAGTHTIETQPFMSLIVSNASDGATTKRIPTEAIRDGHSRGPIILAQDEGIVFSNEVLMGAAGTAVANITIGWREMLNASVPAGI